MDISQSPHPNEPLLEAILTNQDKNAKSQESVLEAILVNQDSNAKSVEPILEASLVKQDEIVKAIKDKPEVQKIKIVTDESELADNFFRMLRGQKGETGEKGDKGDSIKGDKGDKGDKGERGEQGIAGPKGDSIKGDKGEQGKDGRDGLDGRDGVDGKDGAQGPAGKDGKSIDPKDIKKIAKELNNNNNLFLNIPGVKHVNAGSNITITGTDEEPIINSTGGGGSGTVTDVSIVTDNGVSGSVATSTTTPAITLTLGAITPTSIVASSTVTGSNLSGTNTGDQTSIVGITGTKVQFDTAVSDGNIVYVGDTITLAENTSIALDPAGSADGKYTGITVTGTGGAVIAFGDLVCLSQVDSRWELVDISVAAATVGDARKIIGMAVTSSTDGGALTVLLNGIIRADANFPALTIGNPVYASTTGDITVTQPSTTDHIIRVVGFALTADEIYFNPSNDYITHV